jgi:serine/threonine protein kinase
MSADNAPLERTGPYQPAGLPADHLLAGRYKLREKLGEGGMGEVWVAEQTQPVQRKVAVKLIKPGMDSQAVLSRFEAERQALALMDHPNIAKVLDGGRSDQGRPFFVMDYVKGVPLTQYCDEARLTVAQRLALLIPVCQAVQHAHQKGIIHRDLKPSNILVCLYDGQPVPKVIDFGLAKALHQPLTEHTLYTAHGLMLGTPAYMSPEQAEVNNLDIDTRSDIYSLGVILYELLTGSTPLERRQFQEAAWQEMLRLIKEEEPPRPSTRLSGSGTLPKVAAQRQLEPAKLTKLVRGELDWIALKALAKERSRRYQTASGLARDLERYLHDEPVEACPPSVAYRAKKLLRRYKGPVLAAAVVLVALVAGIVGTSWGLVRADRERDLAEKAATAERQAKVEAEAQKEAAEVQQARAEAGEKLAGERLVQMEAEKKRAEQEKQVAQAVRDFLQTKLLGQADTRTQADALLEHGGFAAGANRNVTVRELLDRAAAELTPEKIEANFPKQPLLQAEILQTVGATYYGVGEYGLAVSFHQRAAALRQQQLGPDNLDTLDTLNHLGLAYYGAGKLAEAIKLFEQVGTARQTKLGPDHRDTLIVLNNLAMAYQAAGKLPEAIKLFEQLRAPQENKLGTDDVVTLATLNNLGLTYHAAGRLPEAMKLYAHVRAIQEKKLGSTHPNTLQTLNNLAWAYQAADKLPEAIKLYEQVAAAREVKLGPDHPDTLTTLNNLAVAYRDAQRLPEAIKLFERVRGAFATRLGPQHPSTLVALNNLAGAYQAAGKLAEAIKLFEQVRAAQETRLGPDHPDTLTTLNNLAVAYQEAQRLPEAIRIYEQVHAAFETQLGPQHPSTLTTLSNLAKAHGTAGQLDKSIPLFEEVLKRRAEKLGRDHPDTLDTKANLGTNYCDADRLDEGIPLLEEAYRKGQAHASLAWVGNALRAAYAKASKTAEGSRLIQEVLARTRQQVSPQSPRLASALATAGKQLLELKQYADAEPVLRECLVLRQKLEKAPVAHTPGSPAPTPGPPTVAPWQIANAQSLLGGALLGQKKLPEAEPLLLAGALGLTKDEKAIPPQARRNIAEAMQRLVELYEATGKADEAAQWRKRLAAPAKP